MGIDLVLLCSGKGHRFNTSKLKPLTEFRVDDVWQPVWWLTAKKFFKKGFNNIIVVIPEGSHGAFIESVKETTVHCVEFVYGGDTRNESIRKALECCTADYVMIHDGVRPFVQEWTIKKIMHHAKEDMSVCPFIDADFTSVVDLEITDRNKVGQLITPMLFNRKELVAMYKWLPHSLYKYRQLDVSELYKIYDPTLDFTDAERIERLKLTYPEDRIIFQALFDNGVR